MGGGLFRDTQAEQDLDLGSKEVDMKIPYIVLICINMLIILPICIHMTYNYYILRDTYMYNTRRPGLVIVFNIVAIFFIGMYTPIHIIIMEIYWQNNAKYEEWWDSAFFFTTQVCVFVTFALRTWHSFYDFKLAYSVSNTQWKSIINEKYRNQKESFFLKYHKKLGNPKKTFLYFLIIPATVFSIVFVSIISQKVGYETEYLMLMLLFGYLVAACAILIYIITHTWRHVFDNVHLRGEILIGCVVLCVTVGLEVVIFCIDLISYDVENEKYQQVFNFCFNVITCLSCFALIIVSTQFVRMKVAQKEKLQNAMLASKQKMETKLEMAGLTIENQEEDENRWIFQDEVDFQALISTPDGLLAFLRFLAKEYQLNYLVFAMEVTQYKSYVIPELMRRHKHFVQELESSMIEFPSTMPESTIIYPGKKKHTSERRQFMDLYEKYIDENAEWRIKISSELTNETVELYRRCQMRRTQAISIYNPKSPRSTMLQPLQHIDEQQPITQIATLKTTPLRNSGGSQSKAEVGRVEKKDLKAMVESLDGALNDVIDTLKKAFAKYKETQEFSSWFANLYPSDRGVITRMWRIRQIAHETVIKRDNMTDCKTWTCKHCTLVNRAIYVDNRVRLPKSICMCCGHKNNEIGVLVRTQTLMPNVFRHLTHSRMSSLFAADKHTKKSMTGSGLLGIANDTMHSSMDSFDTEFKDEMHEIIRCDGMDALMEVDLDENIVKEWAKIRLEIMQNEDDNTCDGADCDYIDSCPQVQKLHFVMKCYNYYLGKVCKDDEDKCNKNPNLKQIQYNVASMAELVNNLDDLNLQKLLDIFQHVSTIHFQPAMFEHFEDTIGKCGGGSQCKPLSRNNGRRGGANMTNDDLNDDLNDNRNRNGTEEKEEVKYEPFRPLRRVPTVSNNIDYTNDNGKKKITAEERITLSYLDKWHSFLFHPNVKQKKNIIISPVQEDKEEEEEDEDESDWVLNAPTLGIGNSNKFVSDASAYGKLSKLTSTTKTKMNLMSAEDVAIKSYDDADLHNAANSAEDVYYEYRFGEQIEYHTLPNHFICMKQELIANDIHTITEKAWDDTLAKALLSLEMESVQANYKANDHGLFKQYGVKQGELIGVDNVIAILFYCNFDDLQREFSKTFRKMEEYDSDQSIKDRHCKNFYWLGRALYVAVNFYGQRMQKNQVVWHGLSSKMLFDNFAAYFDCPTSTTTQKNVAQTFSGNGNGVILKLKSKHSNNCSWMLDVSLFSDFTDECERLFLNETLIITDILSIINKRWVSFRKYIGACLYFNKITTGNANDESWNIAESAVIQNTLAKIIIDYLLSNEDVKNENMQRIPEYVRVLFRHYCDGKQKTPLFADIDKIQYKMQRTLQQYLFATSIANKDEFKDDKKQKISGEKIRLLFPNATDYLNDQKELISFVSQMDNDDDGDNNEPDMNDEKSVSIVNSPKRKKS